MAGVSILIVGGESEITQILRDEGFLVRNGGLEDAAVPSDVIVLCGDGTEACRRLKETCLAPVLQVCSTRAACAAALDGGADASLDQPVDAALLAATVRAMLRGVKLRKSLKMESATRLASGASHDFNNLLTIIGGYGQMALDSVKPDNPLRADLEAILEASNRAAALTRQLLSFSRRQIVQPKLLDLNREAAKALPALRVTLGPNVELTTSLKADPARVWIDPAQLEQLFSNPASNARDAMPEGGKFAIATETVEIADPGEPAPVRYVALTMSDTGTGMDEQTAAHLFEPFFTTKGKGKGTGLGLATVYGIVKQAGGAIEIETAPGRGTVVRIHLPLAAEAATSGARTLRPAGSGGETILVVEDEASLRRLANDMLTREGYSVIEAASGAEALDVWQERGDSIDLVLTDVIMPQMSGPELVEKLKAVSPGVKILYMSGYTDDIIARRGFLAIEGAFLHKPFTLDELSQEVRAVLDNKERR
ncbi:MAG: response regulator [Acidobacteriota bacterium]